MSEEENSKELLRLKAGYVQHTSPNNCRNEQKVPESQCNNILTPSVILSSEAFLYWQEELSNRDEKIVIRYLQNFTGFCEFLGKNPDSMIARNRKTNLTHTKEYADDLKVNFQ